MNTLKLLLLIFSCSIESCMTACDNYKTCGECIRYYASEKCVWCSQEDFTENRCRPDYYFNSEKSTCKKEFQNNPDFINNTVENEDFSKTVQFRPQVMEIKARPGIPVNFTMSYKPAKDFPLDVYFLMDYSFTMRSHSTALQKNAFAIHQKLTKLTNNVFFGIGSFIEKPGFPYVFPSIHHSYAFKNHLSLTDDMNYFKKLINDTEFGANYEDPEAGLDALMQVMTCGKEVGWRNGSRRFIVLATDDTYHSAGDGKMIGAIKPNDMQCHLKGNEYDRNISLIHDYPSVSQINKVASAGKFVIIFAALKSVKDVYEALVKQILGARYAELKEASNIGEIIKEAYMDSVTTVKLNYNKVPLFINLEVNHDCDSNPKINCESLQSNPIVNISASIKAIDCPSLSGSVHTIEINPVGLNDILRIHFEVQCQCDCEIGVNSTNDEACRFSGVKQCGVCKCNKGRGGDVCQFNCLDKESRSKSGGCKQQEEDSKLCNGHGECSCGKCQTCDSGFSGEFCQYDDTSCPSPNGKLCAGEEHGKCRHAKCECTQSWAGDDCTCPTDNKDCIGPFSEKLCSGRGTCLCGQCVCNNIGDTNKTYTGVYCDACEECAQERCKELKEYAYCNFINEDQNKCNEKVNQTIDINLVNKTEFESSKWGMATKCREILDNGKFLIFKYQVAPITRQLRLIIQNEVEEPPKPNILLAIGCSVGAVVLIGVLTLILWKILVDLYDKREYEKFCESAKEQGYDVSLNPTYQSPYLEVNNPMFNK